MHPRVSARLPLTVVAALACAVSLAAATGAEARSPDRSSRATTTRALPGRTRLFAFFTDTGADTRRRMLRRLGRIDVLAPNWFRIDPAAPTTVLGQVDRAIMRRARRSGTDVWPVINGQIRDAPEAFATTGERQTFCTRAAAIARQSRADGITIDIEGWDQRRSEALTDLVRRCARALHVDHRRLAVYAPRRVTSHVTGWNGAYEWQALTRSADLVVTSTYSEAWETPGPIVTTPGLAATLGWDRSVSVSRVAPIVALFGLRWPSGGGAPTLISQRAAETEAARTTTGFGRYRLGTTYRTAGGDVVHFVHGAAAARQVRDVRRAGFRWVAIFTAGREGDRFWQRLAPQIGRRPTDVR